MNFTAKPLEWIDPQQPMNYPVYRAKVNIYLLRQYVIDKGEPLMYGKFPVKINGRNIDQKFDTLEDAKQWCELDWQSYARSAYESFVNGESQ